MDTFKTREERRAEFEAALEGALNLRPLYTLMDEEDKISLVGRFPNPDRSLKRIFEGPLNKLFDLGDELRAKAPARFP